MSKLIKNKKTNKNKSGKKHSHSKNSKKSQQCRKLYAKKSKLVKQKKRLSKLNLTGGGFIRKITHFWYPTWPDKDVPGLDENFKTFIDLLVRDIEAYGGGTVIHCSAGVGRTGTIYIILKLVLEKNLNVFDIKKGDVSYDDIKTAITEARKHRMLLVQSSVQLEFICKFFECFDELPEEFRKSMINKETFNTNIGLLERQPYIAKTVGQKDENKPKNRYRDILPYDYTRVILPGVPYINASYLNSDLTTPNSTKIDDNDGFTGIVIASQCPTPDTPGKPGSQQDFLKMLPDPNIKINRIIMVTNFDETSGHKCDDYTNGEIYKGKDIPGVCMITNLSLHENGGVYNFRLEDESNTVVPESIPNQVSPMRGRLGTPETLATIPLGREEFLARQERLKQRRRPTLSNQGRVLRLRSSSPNPRESTTEDQEEGPYRESFERPGQSLLPVNFKSTKHSNWLTPEEKQELLNRARMELRDPSVKTMTNVQKQELLNRARREFRDTSLKINRVDNFINERNFFSYCDCKIMLLYIYVYNLIPNKNSEILKMIEEEPLEGSDNKRKFLNDTLALINYQKPKKLISCSSYKSLSEYLHINTLSRTNKDGTIENIDIHNKTHFMDLFGTSNPEEFKKIIMKLDSIFGPGGTYNKPDISLLTPSIFEAAF